MIEDHRPIRTTLLMGILGGVAGFASALIPEWHGAQPAIRLGIVWTLTAGYALLLVRWGRQRLSVVFFPLIVLGLWGGQLPSGRGFIVMALATLSWIRSGVCFPAPPLRGLLREVVLCGGGAWLAAAPASGSALSWGLGIWMFFLAQTFFFAVGDSGRGSVGVNDRKDRFERARRQAERILARY
ncbi:MAG: hypothetical protein QNJ04_00930 [Desulfobacterales bacterium]|nr:hypothetical protein [Desulfobacterales bacterium]